MGVLQTVRKFTTKYKELAAPVKASLWFVVCGFLQKGIAMLTTPVFTRLMTSAEYGRYNVYSTWFNLVQIIASLNLAAGVYTRGLVGNEEDQDVFSSSMLGLSTVCILFFAGVYLLLHQQINSITGLNTLLMVAMFVEIWATAAYQFWSARERVNYRYRKLVAITLLYVALRPTVGIICVLCSGYNNQVEARAVPAAVVNLIIFSFLFVSIVRKGKVLYRKDYWSYALKFNLPLIPHYLSQIILNQADKLMITRICGTAATAYYSVAYAIASVLQILNNAIAGTMNPWIYKSIKNHQEDQIGPVSYMILGIIALANFIIVAIAPEFLSLMAPADYQEAVWVIPPVTTSVYFMFLYNLFATFEYYYNRTKYVMYVTVASALLNVGLNALFIPRFGFVAAGYTTLFCYVLCAAAHYLFLLKVSRECMDGKRVYKGSVILGFGILLILASIAISLTYRHRIVRYAFLAACMAGVFVKRRKFIGVFSTLKER